MPIDQNQHLIKKSPQETSPLTSSNPPAPNAWKGWLTLFRPPNLFTVPGDPLVGALLAALALHIIPSWNAVYAVMGAALAFYASGLLANDFFDRDCDARERPDRPIPSGAVSPLAAKWAAIFLTLAGVLFTLPAGNTASAIGILVALASWLYNVFAKRIPWLAPFSMGICRGLSLMLGAAILGLPGVTSPAVLMAALFLTLYIALITIIARNEADTDAPPIPTWCRWGIPTILTAWLAIFLLNPGSPLVFQWKSMSILLGVMSILWALVWTAQMRRHASPRVVQASVGGLIRGLLFTQAALCASCGGVGEGFALLLLFLFPVSGWISRWFYGS